MPDDDQTNLQRAVDAWRPIEGLIRRPRFLAPSLRDGPWPAAHHAAVWGLGQVLAAAAQLVLLEAEGAGFDPGVLTVLTRILERHRDGSGYDPFPGDRPRYYDDNAWVGLDFVQLQLATGDDRWLPEAERVLQFLQQGTTPDGGVFWVESPKQSIHTCSTAPTGELAARVHLLTGDPAAAELTERIGRYLHAHLRRTDALYRDNVRVDGSVDDAIYSYNQGTPVGLDVLRHRIDGDRSHLEAAHATAEAALAHFAQDDRLWTQAPCFNAIFFRNLLALDATDPHPRVRDDLHRYLDRLWGEARDPRTGWFTEGGIGRYERGGVLDQSGVVQLFAMATADRTRAVDLC